MLLYKHGGMTAVERNPSTKRISTRVMEAACLKHRFNL